MQYCIGLDVSTAIIGICVLDDTGDVVLLDHIDFSKHKVSIYKKAAIALKHFEKLAKNYSIDKIIIEEFLLRYKPGKSSAHTLTTLARFNGIIGYITSQIFGVEPVTILATHARKVVGVYIDKKLKKQIGIKTIIIDHVKSLLGDKLQVAYTKTGKYKPYMADRCDAYVLARAAFLEHNK